MTGFGARGPGRVLVRGGGPGLWRVLTESPDDTASAGNPGEVVRRDIMENLRRVLNARRGRCEGHPEFGMPDVSDLFVTSRGLAQLAREMKAAIERWEPRLAPPVEVRAAAAPSGASGGFEVSFSVRAKLVAPWNDLCAIRTTVLADGRVEIE